MRGSFKQNGVWSGALLCRTQPYFSLRLFGCLHYRALTFLFFSLSLTHTFHPHSSSLMFYVCTFGKSLAFSFPFLFLFLFEHAACVTLRFAAVGSLLSLLSFSPLHVLSLSLYLCITLVMVSRGVIVVVYSVLKGLLMVETCAVCNI